MDCTTCGKPIHPERLEFLPHTKLCTPCAAKNPEPLRHDPNEVCAKPALTARNGFAAND